jgi:hypothetical protein
MEKAKINNGLRHPQLTPQLSDSSVGKRNRHQLYLLIDWIRHNYIGSTVIYMKVA